MTFKARALGLLWVGVLATVGGLGFGPGQQKADPPVVTNVDLARYAGGWKEIARYPTTFQADCARSTATYGVLEDGAAVSVRNVCEKKNGGQSSIEGTAKVVAPGKLKVDFGWFRVGDYWIVDLDEDYTRAIVSGPGRDSLFVLAREAPYTEKELKALRKRLTELGFDVSRLVYDEWN